MQYLLDTVTIIRHFSGEGFVGKKAAEILGDYENRNVGFKEFKSVQGITTIWE